MKPTQRNRDEFVRHRGDLTDLDFYRRRAAALRVQAMRNSVGLRSACAGLVMIIAFPVAFAVAAASLHALTSNGIARTSVAPVK